MRIPLDYYRILSVPIKATDQQLEQAYSDRLLQQPRREFNEYAIEARQALIKKAYQILSDSQTRVEYDAQFLVNMQPVEPLEVPEVSEDNQDTEEVLEETTEAKEVLEPILDSSSTANTAIVDNSTINPTIDIPNSELVGALLIMQELGEYELVLTQGIEYYNSQEFSQFQQQNSEEVNVATQENIILALALAYMELGREQWHRREYEAAAISSQLGIDILNQENLFPLVKQELELDLYKLRPYRVLELISQNMPNSAPRAKGFHLLQDMLTQREGIEGKGEDLSGLSFDQFLCFIQQLRTYLTSIEQKQLFDKESQNDSAIGSYLAVYALLGQGFTGKKPELVLRAQRKLDYLSEKQDVTWEQAVCALLLGHTEKAIAKVHKTQDTSKLNQVLQHAPGSADLLPGMCFYTEKWLHEDVLIQFVDLVDTKLTLKEYFADREVQAYLDKLTPSTVLVTAETASIASSQSTIEEPKPAQQNGIGVLSRWRSIFSEKNSSETVVSANQIIQNTPKGNRLTTATIERGAKGATRQGKTTGKPKAKSPAKHRPSSPRNGHRKKSANPQAMSLSLPLEPRKRAVPASVMYKAQGQAKQKKMAGKRKIDPATRMKGWLFILGLIFGVGAIGFMATKLFLNPSQQNAKARIAIAISDPAIELPPAKPAVAKPELTFTEKSQQVIEKWLSSKSAAFGKEYQISELNSILAEPLLTTWRDRAMAYKTGNFYREYQHQIKMKSAKVDPNNPNKAVVDVEVKEAAQHYQSGQLDNAQSYDDNLLVRYQLIRQDSKWLIQNAEVLETL
ncbi:MAG: IMS domain-containing protein [Pleurocapsa sp.]